MDRRCTPPDLAPRAVAVAVVGACLVGGLTGILVAAGPRAGAGVLWVLAASSVVALLCVPVVLLRTRWAAGTGRDRLTGLLDRRAFDQALYEHLAASTGTGGRLSAALLDLDHFRATNDVHGHEAGDRVLRQVADTWRRILPPGAVLARHAGDEFAVLLPGLSGPQAWSMLDGLVTGHPRIALSVGVAEHVAGDSAAQLMRRADQALYTAKSTGRRRCELVGERTPDLVRDLAAALAAGSLQTSFQPIVQLATDTVLGVEALVRWDRPGHGAVPPPEFVAVAEAHGLIGQLGETVLRSACSQLAALHATTGRRLRLGINVSGRELSDPQYPDRVRAVLEETGWPAGEVVVEVTESVLDADSLTAVASLHSLRAMGLLVAIDDFGTGYSSLSRLDTLPADILKVDAAFTATITTSHRRAQMLRTVVDLADALGLDVIAEGVETTDQLELVTALGCTHGQGWLFGRPVPLPELAAALDRQHVARPS